MRQHFRYLSDNLSVTVDTTQTGNIPYRVEMKPTSINDSMYTVIYRGSIYSQGNPITIQLNDIIETNMDDYTWFKNRNISTGSTAMETRQTYVDVRLILETYEEELIYTLTDILNAYISPNMKHELKFDTNQSGTIKSFSELGYNVLPHIPYGTQQWIDEDMSVFFNLPIKLFASKDISRVAIRFQPKNGIIVNGPTLANLLGPVTGINLSSFIMNSAPSHSSVEVTITAASQSSIIKLAVIDYDPADYYLMWINRHGATQCQPFCKKNTLNESVSTGYITTLNNESITANKTVDYTWTLNSHWLTYDEHGEFESLLTSKYVWLYDMKKGVFFPVNVTDSKWSYKNINNTKKPFNLTVNVKKSQSQNIVY